MFTPHTLSQKPSAAFPGTITISTTDCNPTVNGREKVICVRKLDHQQILQKAELLRNSSGQRLRRITKPVKSMNEGVRGIFSPFHGQKHVI